MRKTLNPHSQNRAFIFLLFTIASAFQVGTDLYLPTFPALGEALGADNFQVQMTLSAFLGGTVIFQLFYGPLSDRLGRRKILLIGLGISTVASILCTSVTSINQLIAFRFLQGSGIGACALMTRAVLRDIYSVNIFAEKVSFINVGLAFVPSFGAIVGSYSLLCLGWKGGFLILALIYGSLFLAVLRWLPETLQIDNGSLTSIKDVLKGYSTVLSNKAFFAFATSTGLAFGGWVAYLSSAPFLFQVELGLSPVEYAWLLFCLTICLASASMINGLFVRKIGIQRLLKMGLGTLLASGLFFTICAIMQHLSVLALIVGGMIYALGSGFIYSNMKAGAFNLFPNKAGITAAAYGCVQIAMTGLISVLVAYLPETNTLYLGLLFLVLPSLSLVLLYYLTQFK